MFLRVTDPRSGINGNPGKSKCEVAVTRSLSLLTSAATSEKKNGGRIFPTPPCL